MQFCSCAKLLLFPFGFNCKHTNSCFFVRLLCISSSYAIHNAAQRLQFLSHSQWYLNDLNIHNALLSHSTCSENWNSKRIHPCVAPVLIPKLLNSKVGSKVETYFGTCGVKFGVLVDLHLNEDLFTMNC